MERDQLHNAQPEAGSDMKRGGAGSGGRCASDADRGGRGEMPTDFINCEMNSKPREVRRCQRKESQTIQRAA